ncbi:MAG: single-strand DNA-binding protein [Brevundimonas sp.]|jgi:single-strand DNA-binding protein|uniref:single-stranded DNA-binding protein n=1 Tax=Brevundimonas sp. TaxID=1871086 RepID=UPI0039E70D10
MQTITIEGYLAGDPSILSSQTDGRTRATFRILETTRFRRADGQPAERTTGFNCVCFNEVTAQQYIAPFARKGTRVVVQGHVENDSWTGKDGVEHYDLRVVVADLRVKNRRSEPDGPEGPHQADPDTGADDDIPF